MSPDEAQPGLDRLCVQQMSSVCGGPGRKVMLGLSGLVWSGLVQVQARGSRPLSSVLFGSGTVGSGSERRTCEVRTDQPVSSVIHDDPNKDGDRVSTSSIAI